MQHVIRPSYKSRSPRSLIHQHDDLDTLSDSSGSNPNSDCCESGSTPVSVREMVRRYNTATQQEQTKLPPRLTPRRQLSNHALMSSRSSYVGINTFGSTTNIKPTVTRLQGHEEKIRTTRYAAGANCYECHDVGGGAKRKCECQLLCGKRRHHSMRSELDSPLEISGALEKQRNLPPIPQRSGTPIDETDLQPLTASYQSKTTIAKTTSGVRIIIDIFFDEDQHMSPAEVVGTRVETDIPQSRILAEFQEQAHNLIENGSAEGQLEQVTSS